MKKGEIKETNIPGSRAIITRTEQVVVSDNSEEAIEQSRQILINDGLNPDEFSITPAVRLGKREAVYFEDEFTEEIRQEGIKQGIFEAGVKYGQGSSKQEVEQASADTLRQRQAQQSNALPLRIETKGTDTHRRELFAALIAENFISNMTDGNTFLWVMGSRQVTPHPFVPVVWLKSKQLLREVLEPIIICSKAEMERAVPLLFTNKNGQRMSLAKSRPVPGRKESKTLSRILATIYDVGSQ